MCIPGIGRLLQKVHKKNCEDSKAINLAHQAAGKVQMDPRVSRSLHKIKGCYHAGTYSTLSQPQQEIYCLHICVR